MFNIPISRKNQVFLSHLKHTKFLKRSNLATFDVETKDGLLGQEIFCWSLCYIRQFSSTKKLKVIQRFNNDFSEILTLFKQKTIIFVHNLSFDIRFIEDFCIRNQIFDFKKIKSGSNIIAFILNKFKIKFIDSVQFLQSTQDQAEKDWQIDSELCKIECNDIFNKNFTLWTENDKKRLIHHNENDVKALHQIMSKFRIEMFESNNVDVLQTISLASLSMKAFRKDIESDIVNPFLFLKTFIDKKGKKHIGYEIDTDKEEFVRKSYFGGRTEVFNSAVHQNVAVYDRNSMYPAVMNEEFYPNAYPAWVNNSSVLMKIIEGIDKRLGFIEAEIIPNPLENIPILPERIDKKVIFANNRKKGVYTTIELQIAYQHHYQIKPKRGLIYDSSDHIFSKFIQRNYALRMKYEAEKQKGKKKMIKILMNALYGKFGQNFIKKITSFRYFSDKNIAIQFICNQQLTQKAIKNKSIFETNIQQIYNSFIVEYQENMIMKKSFMNIAIASFITAYSRISLFNKITECNQQSIEVFNVDTDCVAVLKNDKIKTGKNLGDWKIEDVYESVKFLCPKVYFGKIENENEMKNEIKIKGLDRSEINRIKDKNSLTLEQIEFELRLQHNLNNKYSTDTQAHKKADILAISTNRKKKFTFINHKRLFDEKGNSIPYSDETIYLLSKKHRISEENEISDEIII